MSCCKCCLFLWSSSSRAAHPMLPPEYSNGEFPSLSFSLSLASPERKAASFHCPSPRRFEVQPAHNTALSTALLPLPAHLSDPISLRHLALGLRFTGENQFPILRDPSTSPACLPALVPQSLTLLVITEAHTAEGPK